MRKVGETHRTFSQLALCRTSVILTGQSGAPMTPCTAVAKGSSKRMQVPLSRPSITQVDIEAVLEVLNSPSLSMGPKLPASQRVMADYSV